MSASFLTLLTRLNRRAVGIGALAMGLLLGFTAIAQQNGDGSAGRQPPASQPAQKTPTSREAGTPATQEAVNDAQERVREMMRRARSQPASEGAGEETPVNPWARRKGETHEEYAERVRAHKQKLAEQAENRPPGKSITPEQAREEARRRSEALAEARERRRLERERRREALRQQAEEAAGRTAGETPGETGGEPPAEQAGEPNQPDWSEEADAETLDEMDRERRGLPVVPPGDEPPIVPDPNAVDPDEGAAEPPSDEAPPPVRGPSPARPGAQPGGQDEDDAAARRAARRRAVERATGQRPPERRRIERRVDDADASRTAAPGADAEVDDGALVAPPPPPADGRTEWFSFNQMPWEDVVKHFAKRIGKPLMNPADIMVGGELTYETTRRFTKQEALDELNFLLVEQGYFMAETDEYVYVLPLNELGKVLSPDRVYPTVEAFEAANPRDMEYASVLIQIRNRPAEVVRDMIAPAMPDRALPVVLGDTNQIQITGLARDVRRFMALYGKLSLKEFDPRETAFIEIQTNVNDIVEMLQQRFDVAAPRRQYNRQNRQWEEVGGGDGDIKFIADDRTKTLIVQATPEKLEEIKEFVQKIDIKPDWEFDTHVIPVKHGSAADIAEALKEIFQQEQGRQAPAIIARNARLTPQQRRAMAGRAQQQQVAPEDIIVEDLYERAKKTVRISAEDRTNTLIVYANKDGLERVKAMLDIIDVPVPSNFRTFALQYADAEEIQPIVQQFAQGVSGQVSVRGRRAGGGGTSVIADSNHNTLLVIAEREQMQSIAEIIEQLDVESAEDMQHVVHLENLTPSRVAQMVAPLLDSGAAGAVRRGRNVRGRAPAAANEQLVPLDEAGILLVICSEDEWAKIEETIRIWDANAVSNRPTERVFTLENATAARIVPVLQQMYGQYNHPVLGRSQVFFTALEDKQFISLGVQPALEEIEALLPSLDVAPQQHPIVILPLQYADAAQVAELAQGLLPETGAATPPRGRNRFAAAGGGNGARVTAEPVTNSLIVQADEATVERVKDFAAEMEAHVQGQEPVRRFYTLENASPREVQALINSIFGGAAGGRGRAAVGSQVKTAIVGQQLVVDAPAIRQEEIAAVILEADERADQGITTRLIKLPGADVRSIAQRLSAAFRTRAREQGLTAEFHDDMTTESILMTVSAEFVEEALGLIDQYEDLTTGLVWKTEPYQLEFATADEAAQWLRAQLVAQMTQTLGSGVARQITVSPDSRTNRIFINAPQVAVEAGKLLLNQYDQEGAAAPDPSIDVWTVSLPGADVGGIARNLQPHLNNLTRSRPDRLQASASADQVTNNLILSAPRDIRDKVDALIAEFASQTDDLAPVQEFFTLKEANADEVAGQLRNILIQQIERQRGRGVAQQVSIVPNARLNQIVINAPKFALEAAGALIAQLDQPPTTQTQLRTIALSNADANSILGVLNNVFRDKLRAGTLQISAEPLTNSLIVGGADDDFEQIAKWANEIDQQSGETALDVHTLEIANADPGEVMRMINDVFNRRTGRQGRSREQEVYATVTNNTLVVMCKPGKLDEIKALVASVDAQTSEDELTTRTYALKVLDAQQVAMQVQLFLRSMGTNTKRGQMQPAAFAEPATNTLVVIAPEEHLPMIEALIAKIETTPLPISDAKVYELSNARADQIARNVETMLRAKIAEQEGVRAKNMQAAVMPDPVGNRLVVFAPLDYHDVIGDVIELIDAAPESGGRTVQIVTLEQGEATELARTMDGVLRAGAAGGPPKVAVVADAASNSLVLTGLPADIAEAQRQIAQLESVSGASIPEIQTFNIAHASAVDVAETLTQLFPAGRTPMDTVTVTADDFYSRLVVTASRRKMSQIREFIKQLDAAPDAGDGETFAGKEIHFVQINRGDPWDIELAVEELYPPEDRGGPVIDADLYGDFIKVVCRPGEFDGILKNIRNVEANVYVESKWKEMKLSGDAAKTLLALQRMYPDVAVDFVQEGGPEIETLVEPLRAEDDLPDWIKERRQRSKEPRPAPAGAAADEKGEVGVNFEQTGAGAALASGRVRARLASQAARAGGRGGAPQALAASDDSPHAIEERLYEYLRSTYALGAAGQDELAPGGDGQAPPKERVQIKVFEDGRIIMQGPRDDVEDIEEAIDVIESDLGVGEVIRIFRFTYGDVTQAARVLDQMFNEPRQVRLPVQRRQPQDQQRDQRQRGDGGDGDNGKGQAGGDLTAQLRAMMGQAQQQQGAGGQGGASSRIRIATDVGNNYLIVKCQESQLPEIRQLLRELDIPPGEVEVRVYQLRNVDAGEAADNIKSVLGIGQRQAGGRQTPPQARNAAQQQILDLLQSTPQFALGGEEGAAKIDQVQIVPNAITNSLLVSSPPDVLEIIERIINELEALTGHQVTVIRSYELLNARLDDVLPLLQDVFGAAAGGRGGEAGRGASPANLGPVSITGDPRNNTIIYSAMSKDVPLIEEQIKALDIEGLISEADLYVCQFGDAASIAQTVGQIFQIGQGGRGGREGAPAGLGGDLRISAEPMTNSIMLYGPAEKRDLIMDHIRNLDVQAASAIREIDVKFAKASKVAEMLLAVVGGSGGALNASDRRGAGAAPGRIMIYGDDNAGKLLVRAPEHVYEEIVQLTATLDQPTDLLQIRKFDLVHADCTTVVGGLEQALGRYLQTVAASGGGRGGLEFDPFTALPDPRTNSVVVIGSPQTFSFVEMALSQIDVPSDDTHALTPRIIHIPLSQDAAQLASTIGQILNDGEQLAAQRAGRPPNLVTIGADAYTNSLIVNCTGQQYEVVKKLVDGLGEIRSGAYVTRVIELRNLTSDEADQIIGRLQQQRNGAAGSTVRPAGGTRSTIFRPSGGGAQGGAQPGSFRSGGLPRGGFQPGGADRNSGGRQFRPPAERPSRRPSRDRGRGGGGGGALRWQAPSPENSIDRSGPTPWGRSIVATAFVRGAFQHAVLARLTGREERQPVEPPRPAQPDPNEPAPGQPPPAGEPAPGQQPPDALRQQLQERLEQLQRGQPARQQPQPGEQPPGRPLPGQQGAGPVQIQVLPPTDTQPGAQTQPSPLDAITGQLRGDVYTVPLDGRRIAITGDPEDIELIERMLALMEQATPESIIEIFELENAKAAAIQPIIEQIITAHLAQTGAVGRMQRFSVIAEARSNTLIVSASADTMELVREVVNHLDQQALTGPTDFRSVPIEHMQAAEAVAQLQPLIERLNQIRQVPAEQQASVQALPRTNSVLIVGTQNDINEIERMIEAMDQPIAEEENFTVGRILVMNLLNAQAEQLAETLNTLIELERTAGTGAAGAGRLIRRLLFTTPEGLELPPLDLDRPIEIIPEPAKNALIILSSPRNNEALEAIVGLFDQLPTGTDVEVKSLPMRHAQAERVAETLQGIFQEGRERALARPTSDTIPEGTMPPQPQTVTGHGLPYPVHISADVRTNAVIAVGRREALQLVAALVSEMDQPSSSVPMSPHILQLRNKQAAQLQASLETLLDERAEALGLAENAARDNAVIIPDERTNSLVVLATDDMYGLIEGIATQLDQADSYRIIQTDFRRLEYADALKLASLLDQLFERKQEAEQNVAEGGQREVLEVLADSRTNSLMLTGTPDYLAEANALVTQLDQSYAPTLEFKARAVMLNSAANIAERLREMVEQTRDQQEGMEATPIHISADPYSNTLLIAASREDMQMVDRWVDILDRPADPGRTTAIVPLASGRNAEQIAERVQEAFATQAQGAAQDLTVWADPTTNSIVAFGPPAIVNDIRSLLNRLDETGALAGAAIRIFKLEQADAETAGEILRSIIELRGGTVGTTGGARAAGTATAQEEAASQIMLIWNRLHPELGVETLRAMRTGITVIDNVRTNELIVLAPPDSMPLIESLVDAIDIPPDAAKIRIFPLRNSDAERMVETLENLFQTGEAARTAAADEEQERQLQLEDLAAGGRQTLTFTADVRTNSIIAAGTTGYLDLVEELILKLDTQDIQQRETLVIAPGNNEAMVIQQMLQELSEREQEMLSTLEEELSVSERMRREIVAVASEETNRLILNFDPRRKQEMLDLVRELDQAPPQVMIQVLIAEVTLSDSLELGVEFAFQDLQFQKAGPTDTTSFDYIGGTDIGAAGAGLGGFTFTISGADFNFLLRTLQSESRLSVLSRPQIIAMDNLEARIEVTNDVPYVSGTQTSVTGQIATAVSRQDVGIILEVTPHINPDDFVRMHVRQEVSDLTDSTVPVAPGVTSPIFFRREAETDVTVKNNETIVLGGLISSGDRRTEQKVPLMGDVPVIGLLFRNTNVTNDHTELLVVLTPRVIRTVEQYRDLSIRERDLTGELPETVLTSPLMEGLRVRPGELRLDTDDGLLEPLPARPPGAFGPGGPAANGAERYGPPPARDDGYRRPPPQADEPPAPSYDVPISRAAGASASPGRR